MDFWISDWISGFHSGFLDFSLDFWISVWISADGVRDFFRDGPFGTDQRAGVCAHTLSCFPSLRESSLVPRPLPDVNFYLTHPFLDLVSAQSSSWKTAHARVGGVQPLNLQEMALFGYPTSNS